MTDRNSVQLRGLSIDELRRSATTTTSPFEYARQNTPSKSPENPLAFVFGSTSLGSKNSSVLDTPSLPQSTELPCSFAFRASAIHNMVREREPARNPLVSSQAKVSSSSSNSQKNPIDVSSSPLPPQSDVPTFGNPTALNTNASPAAKASSRAIEGQKIRRSNDTSNYQNLFAKKRPGDIGYHKPPSSGNPLANVGRESAKVNSNSTQNGYGFGDSMKENVERSTRPVAVPRRDEDDIFSIPKPTNFPASTWRPAAPPSFSSGSNSNPFYQPQSEFVDLTAAVPRGPVIRGFNDREVFGNGVFEASDPTIYIDSRQAEESIKALLEGAMDEEDGSVRTRRKKKELDAKVDDLARKIQGLDVQQVNAEQKEEEEEDDGSREGLKVKLLPHQIDGVEWMQNKESGTKGLKGTRPKGGILADDMGLGKTIQSIALILANPRPTAEAPEESRLKIDPKTDRSTLVVAPLALIKQWEAEIRDRVEQDHALKVRVHHGPSRTKSYKDLRKYDVVITTYQTLTSEHDENAEVKTALFGVNWYRIILDEAHSIKNRNAKSTKAACALNSEYRWCLTGTPLQNNLDELQSLIRFLRIKPYDNLDVWREQITKPINNGRGGQSIRRLRVFLSAFMKRRTKDVLKADRQEKPSAGFKIVKRTVESISVEFNQQERAFYERLEARTDRSLERMMAGNQMSYASALVLLMRLRQACNHPRLLGADLSKEQDAARGSQTPSRKGSKADDMDDIANMLGALSVETKRCDICQIDLDEKDIQNGMVRCTECEEDLRAAEATRLPKKKVKKTAKKERKMNRRVILDSDDEDESKIVQNSESEEDGSKEEEETEVSDDEEDEDDKEASDSDYDQPTQASAISSTKIRHLLKILKHDSGTHKYIVFSFFTSMLDLIEPFLRRHNLRYTRYDGAMRNDAREASLESLRKNDDVRILLCSLRAGSLGLNLTAASRVVILEPFWNPFVEEQAIDRVHRLNQTQDVIVHKLTIKNSVEERILELQERKRELAKQTIEGQKGAKGGNLSLNEMLRLFRHDGEKDAKLDMIGMKDGRSLFDRDSQSTDDAPTRSTDELPRRHQKIKKARERREDPIYGRRWD